MAFAAVFGKKAMITAAAIGSQRVMERMLVILPSGVGCRVSGVGTGRPRGACEHARARVLPTADTRHPTPRSCEHPHEDDHAQEKHQRVVADVAGLEEAEEIADGGDDVAEERERGRR